MQIVYTIEQLSPQEQQTATAVIKDIHSGFGTLYRQLDDEHPVKNCAWVIKELMLQQNYALLEHHVPRSAFADPRLAMELCKMDPRLIRNLDPQLVKDKHPMVQELVQAFPHAPTYMPSSVLVGDVVEHLLALDVYNPHQAWDDQTLRGAHALLTHVSESFWTHERAMAFAPHVPEIVAKVQSLKDDVQVQVLLIQQNAYHYKTLGWQMRSHPDVLQQALSSNGELMEYAPWHVQAHEPWATLALQSSAAAYLYLDHTVAAQPHIARRALDSASNYELTNILQAVPKCLKAQRAFCDQILDVLEQRKNTSIQPSQCFDPSVLLSDDFTLRLCAAQPHRLKEIHQHHPNGIWHLTEPAAAMCARHSEMFEKAPLSKDRDFCFRVLEHALSSTDDTHRVLNHMVRNGIAIEKEQFLKILQHKPSAYFWMPEHIMSDPQAILTVLQSPTENEALLEEAIANLPANIFKNNEPLLHTYLDHLITPSVVQPNGQTFRDRHLVQLIEQLIPQPLMQQLRTDLPTAERFMAQHPEMYPSLGDQFKEHAPFFERYLQVHTTPLHVHAVPTLMGNDAHYALMAVQCNPENYKFLPSDLRAQESIAWHYATHAAYPAKIPHALISDTEWVLKVSQKRQDLRVLEDATSGIKGLVTKTLRQLEKTNQHATLLDAVNHLASKRAAQAERKAITSALKEVASAPKRPATLRPLPRAL